MRMCMTTREGFDHGKSDVCLRSARNIVEADSLDTSVTEAQREAARAILAANNNEEDKK